MHQATRCAGIRPIVSNQKPHPSVCLFTVAYDKKIYKHSWQDMSNSQTLQFDVKNSPQNQTQWLLNLTIEKSKSRRVQL